MESEDDNLASSMNALTTYNRENPDEEHIRVILEAIRHAAKNGQFSITVDRDLGVSRCVIDRLLKVGYRVEHTGYGDLAFSWGGSPSCEDVLVLIREAKRDGKKNLELPKLPLAVVFELRALHGYNVNDDTGDAKISWEK